MIHKLNSIHKLVGFIVFFFVLSIKSSSQNITTFAGTGSKGFNGDGGLATNAQMRNPFSIAVDSAGNTYIADYGNNRIRRVDSNGIITTFAGTGSSGYSGDGGLAVNAELYSPIAITADKNGNIYIVDSNNYRIRKVDTNGIISTVAGVGSVGSGSGFSGDGGPAINANISYTSDIAADSDGNIYIADYGNNRIRRIDSQGIISTIAGTGAAGYNGDGGAATNAMLNQPSAIAIDKSGNLYIADEFNHRIRKVDTNGIISTVAGNGEYQFYGSADGQLATNASIIFPRGVGVDNYDQLYISHSLDMITRVSSQGVINRFAGVEFEQGYNGDNIAPDKAHFYNPYDLTFTKGNNKLFIADVGNTRVRLIDISKNTNLSGISLSTGELSPAFAPETTNYAATVSNSQVSINIIPELVEATAKVTVNGMNVNSGSTSSDIPLSPGSNTINVTVTAQDGFNTKNYTIAITRKQNTAPSFGSIADQSIDENSTFSFTSAATDTDVPANNITYSFTGAVPTGMNLDPTSGEISWTPTENQGPNSYPITIRATDDGLPALFDEATFNVFVEEINSAPVLSTIGNQSVDENEEMTFIVSGSDADLPANSLTYYITETPPAGSTFNPETGSFTWTPGEAQDGEYVLTINVSDGISTDTEDITLIVNEVNTPPVLENIGNKVVEELSELKFTATATDIDLPANTLRYSLGGTVPEGASINPSSGEFSWIPSEAQNGSHILTIEVSDEIITVSKEFIVTVNEVNSAPQLFLIPNKSVNELSELNFTAGVIDRDLPTNDFTYSLGSNAPTGASIGPESGIFSWTPSEQQDGEYQVTIMVSDGIATDEATFTISVQELNSAPVLSTPGDQFVDEKELLTFDVTATDNDFPADVLIFSLVGTVPEGASLDSDSGVFSWIPTEEQSGTHLLTAQVSDGDLVDQKQFLVVVNEVNTAPVLTAITDKTVDEQKELSFFVEVTDIDLPANELTFSLEGSVPAGAMINSSSGEFAWVPAEDQDGTYEFTIRVADSNSFDQKNFSVTVNDINTSPTLAVIGSKTVNELNEIRFGVSATDNDLPAEQLTYSLGENTPSGASIDASSGLFSWVPSEQQDGSYTIDVIVSDGQLSDQTQFTVTVNEVNLPPNLLPIGNKSIKEGEELRFTIEATDTDFPANEITYSIQGDIPVNATIDPITGEFLWIPEEEQDGVYDITFQASDGQLFVEESITVFVEETNSSPVLNSIGNKTVSELSILEFTVEASDPDLPANSLRYSLAENAPIGATIDANSGEFSWIPTEEQDGEYELTIIVSDGIASDSKVVSIIVDEVNAVPVLTTIGNKTVNELVEVQFTAKAIDEDLPENELIYTLYGSAPQGAKIDSLTGLFSWVPNESQNGLHEITVRASDGKAFSEETLTIEVLEVNLLPEITTEPDTIVKVNELYSYTLEASDNDLPENDLMLNFDFLPSWLTLDSKAFTISGTPDGDDVGIHTVILSVSDGLASVTQTFEVRVETITGLQKVYGRLSLDVYPNPVSDHLHLKINSETNYKQTTIELTNDAGQFVFQESGRLDELNDQLNRVIKELAAGIYILRVMADKEIAVRKIVKK